MAQTPIDYFNTLTVDARREFLGKFTNTLPTGTYTALSFSNVEKAHLVKMGANAYSEYFFQSKLLNNTAGTGIIRDILGQVQLQCLDADFNAVTQRVQEFKKHSITFSSPEMTRRTLVDEIVMLSVKVAKSSLNREILFAEEHEYDIKAPMNGVRGVGFVHSTTTKYVLTGPIDYVLVSLDNNAANQNKTNSGQNVWQQQHLMAARSATCPIEVKVETPAGHISKLGHLFNGGMCQAFAQGFVVGEAVDKAYRPFVLTDGNIWIFSILKKDPNDPTWFHTFIEWDMNVDILKLIVATLVCWSCFPSSEVFQKIENKRTTGMSVGFEAKSTLK